MPKNMYTVRMIAPEGNVLHERVTDDPTWYLGNMINWEAVKTGERIEIVCNDPRDGYTDIPTAYIDFCLACGDAVTPWVDEVCGCCGRMWGHDATRENVCRHKHVEGVIWKSLLMIEGQN